jgi:pilus assembly protein CpaB
MTNQRRTVGIIAAVVLALLGTLGLVAYVQGAKDRAVAGEKLVKVYVASDKIPAGTPATKLAALVKTEKVPAKVRATDAVTNLKDIKGDVTSIEVLPGEQLVTSRFVAANTSLVASHSAKGVPVGFFGTTMSLEPEQALGGQLRAGDRVAVVGVQNGQGTDADVSKLIGSNVLVTSVQIDGSNGDHPEKKEVTAAPTGKFFVTLALTQAELESSVTAMNSGGKIWLAADPGTGAAR